MTSFADLGLGEPFVTTLAAEQYTTPTPIQVQAVPHVLAGRDLLGIAQTGTGKTAAFALPILAGLAANRRASPRRGCHVLVLTPTRELASQIAASFRTYARGLRISVTTVFGGVAYGPQTKTMASGVDILVATPGRLLDHMGERTIGLDKVGVLVLDEADRMLDMGFIQPIRRIIAALPTKRQNLLFSATMPKEIGGLAADILRDPVEVSVAPSATTAERVRQQVILVHTSDKRTVLAEMLADRTIGRALVFTRTKRGADRVARHLSDSGVDAAAIHGNKSQGQRERALDGFRGGHTRVLVATDIAARGIDVDGITHVINFELPNIPESYVHRIGRTARAGADGVAISLCDAEERPYLRDIETLIRQSLPVQDRRGGRASAVAAEPREHAGASPKAGARISPKAGARISPKAGVRTSQKTVARTQPTPANAQRRAASGPAKPAALPADGGLSALGFLKQPIRIAASGPEVNRQSGAGRSRAAR